MTSNPSHRSTADSADERRLVRAMLAGDEAAFERFCSEYLPVLQRFAHSRLPEDPELARDVAQATLCKVFDRLDTFRGDSSLATWICVCCRNEIGMLHRRKGRGPRWTELDEATEAHALAPPGQGPQLALLAREEADLVHETLDLLPPSYGKALEWKYLEGLPVREIAARLELGAKAAESLLTRARLTFRDLYQRLKNGDTARPNARVRSFGARRRPA